MTFTASFPSRPADGSRSRIEGIDGLIFTVRAITHDKTGDWIAEWPRCIVGVRVSSDTEAMIVGDARLRVTECGLTFGAYGACVRRAQHEGDCASAHGDRFEGRVMTGSVRRFLSNAERMMFHLCRDCAGTGEWDDFVTCETCHGFGEPDASADWDAALDERDARERAATLADVRAAEHNLTARRRAMAAHPAGKGRTLRIGGTYPRTLPTTAGLSASDRQTFHELGMLLTPNLWNI